GEIVILLNNDTETAPGWVSAIVDTFARHPEAGLVASKMLLFDRRDHFHTAGDLFRVDGRLFNRGVWERDEGQYDQEEYVFSACGGSAAYRRAMLDEIGLLDDDFFFSCEDMDLAWRAQLAGYRCVYQPAAVVYHRLAATGGGVTASYHDGRNMIWLLVKNYPGALWRKHGLKVLRAQLGLAWEALRAWRGAAARARLRGMVAGLIGIPRMMRKRRGIQRARRVSLAYLESILTPMPDEAPASQRK
ncbi:MAG: glycosyltransferase family 2 protein, partial [Chloroflexota bacterium]